MGLPRMEPEPEPEPLEEAQSSERQIRIEDLRWQRFPVVEPQRSLAQVEEADLVRPRPQRARVGQLSERH